MSIEATHEHWCKDKIQKVILFHNIVLLLFHYKLKIPVAESQDYTCDRIKLSANETIEKAQQLSIVERKRKLLFHYEKIDWITLSLMIKLELTDKPCFHSSNSTIWLIQDMLVKEDSLQTGDNKKKTLFWFTRSHWAGHSVTVLLWQIET